MRDVLLDGMKMLMEILEKSMYGHWLKRTGAEGKDLYGSDAEAGMNVEMLDDMDAEEGRLVIRWKDGGGSRDFCTGVSLQQHGY